MDKKQLISIVIGVLILGFAVFIVFSTKRPPGGAVVPGGQTETGVSKTMAPAPIDVKVPEPNSSVPANVAKPSVVTPASPGSPANFRHFNLRIEGNKFIPDTVIVNKGDVVDLAISAVDKNYDFNQPDFGLRKSIPKGQTGGLQFGAISAGKFTFFCSVCGGPDKGPVGYIIIIER